MVDIGKYNKLYVIKEVDFGLYLAEKHGEQEILLPLKYIPAHTKVDDLLEVFIYFDSEGRIIATTLKPLATVGEFAYLTVKETTDFGAFMDLGIAKDVFVPNREQSFPMRIDGKYIVYLYLDEKTDRIVATSKWLKFIDQSHIDVEEGQEVHLLISNYTDLGYNAIINNQYVGLLYHNEVFEPIQIGDKKTGYVKKIREENKIDLSLRPQGYGHVVASKGTVLDILKENKGVLALGDKSSPDEIYDKVHLSKKAFKKVIGGLYKEGLIEISDTEIRLLTGKG